jgi:hypothetical protein
MTALKEVLCDFIGACLDRLQFGDTDVSLAIGKKTKEMIKSTDKCV